MSVNKALSDKDAVGIGRKGTIDKPFILKAPFWTVDTLFFAKPNEDVPLSFLFAVFQTIIWMELNAASGVPSLSKTTIEDVEINIPTNFDERMIIGQYFQDLDSLIEQRQSNTDRLRHLKQAMLQRMFV